VRKEKRKKHAKERPQAKDENAPKEGNLKETWRRKSLSHALSSGWVQNSTIAFLGTMVLLGAAMWTKTQVRVAAIGFGLMGTIALWILVLVITKYADDSVPKIAYFGGLIPGSETVPLLPAGMSDDTVQLLLGDDLRVLSASENPVFTKDGKSFLSIGVKDGLMRITATVLDSNNNPICRIINNEFQAFPERAFNPKQPDEHSLVVRDSSGVEVLNIQFRNPKTIWLIGRFQITGTAEPVLITRSDGIRWPGGGGIGHLTLDMTQAKGGAVIAF
jgi:hypothetical protein